MEGERRGQSTTVLAISSFRPQPPWAVATVRQSAHVSTDPNPPLLRPGPPLFVMSPLPARQPSCLLVGLNCRPCVTTIDTAVLKQTN